MRRDIILTADGSHTISIPEMNVTYHSIHGAIQESLHVFIAAGLKNVARPETGEALHILEMGFGTGLNALLTMAEAEKMQQPVHYITLELFPLDNEQVRSLNYCTQPGYRHLQSLFEQMHTGEWEKELAVTNFFTLLKSRTNLLNPLNHAGGQAGVKPLDLIYFDAFAPGSQPGLWTKDVFERLYALLQPGGKLVTYCSKSDVRRAMQAAGFTIEKIPGPPGKREMLRAAKPAH